MIDTSDWWYRRHHESTGHDTVSRYGEPQRCLTCGATEDADDADKGDIAALRD